MNINATSPRLWRRFEILQSHNEQALCRMLDKKRLTRADLYLILTVLKVRDGCEDTFETCYEELQSRYGWTKDPQ